MALYFQGYELQRFAFTSVNNDTIQPEFATVPSGEFWALYDGYCWRVAGDRTVNAAFLYGTHDYPIVLRIQTGAASITNICLYGPRPYPMSNGWSVRFRTDNAGSSDGLWNGALLVAKFTTQAPKKKPASADVGNIVTPPKTGATFIPLSPPDTIDAKKLQMVIQGSQGLGS